MKKTTTLYLTRGSLVAALYVALTYAAALFGLSSGAIQFRISEALSILPIFIPEAIPGLTIGCLIANLVSGSVVWDILFGTIATLLGALGARAIGRIAKNKIWLATLPTIFFKRAYSATRLDFCVRCTGCLLLLGFNRWNRRDCVRGDFRYRARLFDKEITFF